MELDARLSITIVGRVQAVFFRRGAKTQADKLGILGVVWNAHDGSVCIIAEGKKEHLHVFLDWCYSGTFFSKVKKLSFVWEESKKEFSHFQILRKGRYLEDKLFALRNFSERLRDDILLPKHIVIIPDGNRRWARVQKKEIFRGHEQGVKNTIGIFEESLRLKIPYLTFWGFSTENWNRSEKEIKYLMHLMRNFFDRLKEKMFEHHVQFRHFGRKDRLPKDIATYLQKLENDTEMFTNRSFGLALDYGGRDEILRAIKKLKNSGKQISEENFSHALDTYGFPDPDFIIRTSGEYRLSGMMPWQGTYAELYFTDKLFPDFDVSQFRYALIDFQNRRRRFGK
jgi:undecaprenyl diphosphate synthase